MSERCANEIGKAKVEKRNTKFENREEKQGAMMVPGSLRYVPQNARHSGRDDRVRKRPTRRTKQRSKEAKKRVIREQEANRGLHRGRREEKGK
jgi:hypothetical protein